MRLHRVVFALLSVFTLCSVYAAAEDAEYLFRLRPGAADTLDLPDMDVRPVCAAEDVYVTGNESLVRSLDSEGLLFYYENNGLVSLMDYGPDLAALSAEAWTHAMLGADYAMERGNGGEGVRIGIIDSGLMSEFSAYSDVMVVPGINYCAAAPSWDTEAVIWKRFVEEEAWRSAQGDEALKKYFEAWQTDLPARYDTSDQVGHGTFVASILASREEGICPKTELVPLKCFTGMKNGSIGDIVAAIYDAVDVYHCQVINLSLGVTMEYRTLRDAAVYAFQHGVILAASAGNDRRYTYYPAAYDGVVSVGAVDGNKQVFTMSSRSESLWITAPGVSVPALDQSTGNFVNKNGTSFSAPFVSAAAALALSADPSLSPAGFQDLLAETAEDLGDPGRDMDYGFGLLNLGLLLAAVTGDSGTAIPSYYNNTLCLSAWKPPAENDVVWAARYAADGRFLSLEACSGTGGISNLPLSEDAPALLLMGLDRDTLSPLREAVRYGGSLEEGKT